MKAWDETNTENAADHRSTLQNESCQKCGKSLGEHYDSNNVYVVCVPHVMVRTETAYGRESNLSFGIRVF